MKPEEIKELRKRMDVTAAELALKVGVVENTVNQWEMGRRRPSGAALILLRQLAAEPGAGLLPAPALPSATPA